MTTRRQAMLALSLLCGGMGALAQTARTAAPRRIALLYAGPSTDVQNQEQALLAALARLGWNAGKDMTVERAFADGDSTRLARLVDGLIRRHVDVIVALGILAPTAAARATTTIPIVFVEALLPIERGLVESYARPGRNATGIALTTGVEVTTKRLDFLREIVPSATRLAWTGSSTFLSYDTVSGDRYDVIPALQAAASQRGFDSRFHEVRAGELDRLFGDIVKSSAQALMSLGMPPASIVDYIALATRHRLPSASFSRGYVQAGGLLSYGTPDADSASNGIRAAEYVDRILRGAKPGDMPVYRPDKYELIINLKTANLLGLTIPQTLLVRADDVIR